MAVFGSFKEHHWTTSGHSGAVLDHPDASLDLIGTIWGDVRTTWDHLKELRSFPGTILGPLRVVLGGKKQGAMPNLMSDLHLSRSLSFSVLAPFWGLGGARIGQDWD